MNNKCVGAIFCMLAGILFGFRYLTAAIFMGSTSSWSAELFQSALTYTGPALLIAAIVAVVVGVGFLAVGMLTDGKKSGK